MDQIVTVGLDIAKSVFQVHGVDAEEAPVLKRQLKRAQMLKFFGSLPPALIGIEGCGTAHCWARQIAPFRRRSALDRDVEDFDALRDRCGILGGDGVEKAADRSKPAVARADCTRAFMFDMAEERDDLVGCQIGQCDHRHLFPGALRGEPQVQRPSVAVGPDCVAGSLLYSPRASFTILPAELTT